MNLAWEQDSGSVFGEWRLRTSLGLVLAAVAGDYEMFASDMERAHLLIDQARNKCPWAWHMREVITSINPGWGKVADRIRFHGQRYELKNLVRVTDWPDAVALAQPDTDSSTLRPWVGAIDITPGLGVSRYFIAGAAVEFDHKHWVSLPDAVNRDFGKAIRAQAFFWHMRTALTMLFERDSDAKELANSASWKHKAVQCDPHRMPMLELLDYAVGLREHGHSLFDPADEIRWSVWLQNRDP